MSNSEKKSLDLSLYRPKALGESEFIPGVAMPERNFAENEYGKWVGSTTEAGVILVNIVHRDYPDAVCQVQLIPGEDGGRIDTFFQHLSPSENYIPDHVAEEMFLKDALPQILQSFNQKPLQ